MLDASKLEEVFKLSYDYKTFRRHICGSEIILHCHHYNAHLQNVIEGANEIDGKHLIRTSAEAVFAKLLSTSITDINDTEEQWQVAAALYAHLGYGTLDFSKIDDGTISSSHSHFVQGFKAGFSERKEPCDTLAEGYIQACIKVIQDQTVDVREESCAISGESCCTFKVDTNRTTEFYDAPKIEFSFSPLDQAEFQHSPNVDEDAIVSALVGMPIYGNEDGLIPSFGVYLANTPADFYNLVNIRFVEEMKRVNKHKMAIKLLIFAGETCAMNTFRGIMNSAEWEGLIQPMIKESDDNLYGIMAVSNALGWGNWHVKSMEDSSNAEFVSLNGYEALGFKEYGKSSADPQCYMLNGVSAGVMELIFGEGTVEERFGTYASEEESCIINGEQLCTFNVEEV